VGTGSLREFVEVRGRFHRSVRLDQDWESRSDLGGYLLTPVARGLATRMIEGLCEQGGTRAWSVTGPYGSGKSAFALFLRTCSLGERHTTRRGGGCEKTWASAPPRSSRCWRSGAVPP
jgi:hypothetical protein